MHPTDRRRSLLGMLLSAVLVGALAMTTADTATLAVGLGVLLLVSLTVTTNAVTLVVATTGTVIPGADRLRRQWGRAPMPLLAPDLPGNPQPRAPGRVAAEVLLRPAG
ncbi:hypothetical protein [Ornithinimicrobium cryptoxanthini]|uniref:Uncharacterized protein n=1 Tax=Ornithinimicrobium cryptoxanthini TaxID=2934161 RepID=A0ABY4YJI8_9MICO|nr:hypothetical protein [Ornithinimicrobium cryptoxanthini]USQ76868.1 hypothetical protein NF557_02775 [Ornithinimicrobium cryptoxanthini]